MDQHDLPRSFGKTTRTKSKRAPRTQTGPMVWTQVCVRCAESGNLHADRRDGLCSVCIDDIQRGADPARPFRRDPHSRAAHGGVYVAPKNRTQKDGGIFTATATKAAPKKADPMARNRFRSFRQPITCAQCGKRCVSQDTNVQLCERCYDAAGLENEHSDGHHVETPHDGCPDCAQDAADRAQAAAARATGPRQACFDFA